MPATLNQSGQWPVRFLATRPACWRAPCTPSRGRCLEGGQGVELFIPETSQPAGLCHVLGTVAWPLVLPKTLKSDFHRPCSLMSSIETPALAAAVAPPRSEEVPPREPSPRPLHVILSRDPLQPLLPLRISCPAGTAALEGTDGDIRELRPQVFFGRGPVHRAGGVGLDPLVQLGPDGCPDELTGLFRTGNACGTMQDACHPRAHALSRHRGGSAQGGNGVAGGPRCCTRAPTVLTRAGAHEHRAQLGLAEVRRRMVSCSGGMGFRRAWWGGTQWNRRHDTYPPAPQLKLLHRRPRSCR